MAKLFRKIGKGIGNVLLIVVVGPILLCTIIGYAIFDWLYPKPQTPEEIKREWKLS